MFILWWFIHIYMYIMYILYNILSTWHRIEMNKISPCPGHVDGISYGAKFRVPLSAWNGENWAFLLGTIQLVNLQTFSFNLADCQVFSARKAHGWNQMPLIFRVPGSCSSFRRGAVPLWALARLGPKSQCGDLLESHLNINLNPPQKIDNGGKVMCR